MDNFKIIDKKEKKHILEDVRFYFDIFVMQQILLDGAEETLHHEHVEVFEKKTSPKVIVETKKMAPSCETTVESSEDKRLKIGIILLIILVGIMVVNTLLLFMNLQTLRSMISA